MQCKDNADDVLVQKIQSVKEAICWYCVILFGVPGGVSLEQSGFPESLKKA